MSMTDKELVAAAAEAGFSVRGDVVRTMHSSGAWVAVNEQLHRFADIVAAHKRESCAAICDELQDVPATEPRHCAEDIRSRG